MERFCVYVPEVLSFRVNNLFLLSVCFLADVPLEKLLDYGGEQFSRTAERTWAI